jgi:mannose-6-phosphate isomerase-like protein (cupin superfamily)
MNTLKRSLENRVTGEQTTFVAAAEDTDGAFVKTRTTLPGHAAGVVMHYHLTYTETFTVLEGTLDICVGGKNHHYVMRSGEAVHIPLHTPHRFWNGSNQPVTFTVEIRPARHFELATRVSFGLAQAGKVNRAGVPTNIWQLALLFEVSESFLTGWPLFVQKRVFGTLATIARWKGYDPEFSRYTGAEEPVQS